MHIVVHCPDGVPAQYDEAAIERQIVVAIRAWSDDLRDALVEEHGEEHGYSLFKRFESAFPAAYMEDWVARSAVTDIARIEELAERSEPMLSLYRPLEAPPEVIRCKLFSGVGDVAVGGAADVRAHGRERDRRTSL